MTFDIPDAAVEWLKKGERGISSESIFEAMTGLPIGEWGHAAPRDPADVRRCRLLLESVPEWNHRFLEMADKSESWAAIVPLWVELCMTMDIESPDWRDGGGMAPKTYALMNRAASPGGAT